MQIFNRRQRPCPCPPSVSNGHQIRPLRASGGYRNQLFDVVGVRVGRIDGPRLRAFRHHHGGPTSMRLGAVLANHHWMALVSRSRMRGFGKGKVVRSGLGSWMRRCDGGCHENGGTLWMGMVCNGGRGGSMAWMREVVGCGLGGDGTIVVVGRLVHVVGSTH